MKIVINTDQIYLHGGIEKVMATKVNWWARQPDTEVVIVTTEQQGKPACYTLDPRIRIIDLAIDYNRHKSYFTMGNIIKAVSHFRRQRNLFKKLKPDFIISPNINFDHYWLPFIKGQAKVIKERHGSRYLETVVRDSGSLVKRIKLKVSDFLDTQYDRIVVLNPNEQSFVKAPNAVVIPNPIKPSFLEADVSQKIVIAAGRISPVKGFDELIKIWAIIAKEYSEWQLHIYGQDYLGTQQQLAMQIRTLGLEKSVCFMGSVPDMLIPMSKAAVYAMTSETECFPMVLLEALSVGLPVVSYDVPTGPKHILSHKIDSFVVPAKNSAIFAEQLTKLMSDENLRKEMSIRAKANAKQFEISNIMKQWKILLNDLKKK